MIAKPSDFLIVLLVLYLLECLLKVGPEDVVFEPRVRAFTRRKTLLYPGNGSWGWVFLNPLRFGEPVFLSTQRGFTLTWRGVVVGPDEFGSREFIEYDRCNELRADNNRVHLNSRYRLQLSTAAEALAVMAAVAELCKLAPTERQKRIDCSIRSSFDVASLQGAVQDFQVKTKILRTLVWLLVVILLVLFPTVASLRGLGLAVLTTVPLAVGLSIAAAAIYIRLCDRFYPGTTPVDKWAQVAKMAFYPIAVLRIMDALSLPWLAGYNRVAITYALCGRYAAQQSAREALAELMYSIPVVQQHTACETALAECRQTTIEAIARFLGQHDMDRVTVLRSPEPADPSCRSYCPKCLVQYTKLGGLCRDCATIALQPLGMETTLDGVDAT